MYRQNIIVVLARYHSIKFPELGFDSAGYTFITRLEKRFLWEENDKDSFLCWITAGGLTSSHTTLDGSQVGVHRYPIPHIECLLSLNPSLATVRQFQIKTEHNFR